MNLEGKLDEVCVDRKRFVEVFEEKKKLLEDELIYEKNEKVVILKVLEENKEEVNKYIIKV